MKPFEKRTSDSVNHCLRVLAEDFNLRKKKVLKRETLRHLELSLPSLGNKKFLSNRNLNF
jgi:hypothetical protein